MSFKAEITENKIEIRGTGIELLAGLLAYIDALKKNGIPKSFIQEVIEAYLKDEKEKKNKKVQKFDLSNMSKEEAKNFIEKEIFKMFN